MKAPRSFPFLLASLGLWLAVSTATARSMLDIPNVPLSGLQVYMPNEAYQKLVSAPIKAYILVRGQVTSSSISGARVVHSEAGGVYDKVAVIMANHMRVYTDIVGSRIPPTVLIHVFIYGLPDNSEDAFAFAQNDTLGASLVYSRSIMLRHLGLANQKAPASKPKK
jgi:hypothetical protein